MPISSHGRVLILVLILIVCGTAFREWTLGADGDLHIRFLTVGQGDSTLITAPKGTTVLIDGGPDWSTLESLGQHLPFLKRKVDLLVLSHPNLDHLLSFPEVLKRYSVGGIVMSGAENSLPRYRKIFDLAAKHSIPIVTVSAGQSIEIEEGVRMDILWPPKKMPHGFTKNENDASVVLMLRYGERRALFTGDIEKPTEETLVRADADLKADILKVAHHGSRTSSTKPFLRAVGPSIAVISVGENSYGHPREEVISRLLHMNIDVRRTDREGTIEVIW